MCNRENIQKILKSEKIEVKIIRNSKFNKIKNRFCEKKTSVFQKNFVEKDKKVV